VAFVPGRAAYVDGRSGSSSMRLNFAGVPADDIREGVRRIGQAMGGQAGRFGALTATPTGSAQGPEVTGADAEPQAGDVQDAQLADVVQLPRRDETQARRRRDR
jgi:hypothetical protein